MASNKTLNTFLASAVALSVAGGISAANAMDMAGKEKCYGVVKAGANDCGNASKTHSCAGHAATDADGGEWVALPTGVCDKLAGGSLEPKETMLEKAGDAVEETMEKADDAAKGTMGKVEGMMGH
jgi:uncharacterized membrane protein